jgi:hypothetical protein
MTERGSAATPTAPGSVVPGCVASECYEPDDPLHAPEQKAGTPRRDARRRRLDRADYKYRRGCGGRIVIRTSLGEPSHSTIAARDLGHAALPPNRTNASGS